MNQPNLYQIHLSSLRQSCIVLSDVWEKVLSDQTLARRLHDLACRLPDPFPDKEQPQSRWSIEHALPLVSSARASLDFLSKTERFSELGERIAGGLRNILTALDGLLGKKLREANRHLIRGLYVIIDPLVTNGRKPQQIAQEALDGGANILQLRDKERDKGESLGLTRTLKQMCDEKGALLIINDHADLAATVQAHGVHVGLDDLPVASARQVLNPEQIVGRSNHLLKEAIDSEGQGADYIAVGAMYPTDSKDQPIVGGLKLLREVRESVTPPIVAIGGITEARVEEVVKAGADAICVIGAVGLASSPFEASRRMVAAIRRAQGEG